jgi:DNA-binding MarR family transcriptional regulator
LSRDYREPPAIRQGPPEQRALVFALLDLSSDIDAVGQASASVIGINQTDLICLNALFRDGPMTAGALASVVGLTSGATTTAIDRLERAGYAHRRGDPTDRRRVLIEASEEGARQAFALFDGLLEAVAARVSAYTPKQLALMLELIGAFRGILTDYAAQLRAQGRAPGTA